ncbi:hypothetical protein ASPZODRAFT_15462 [Penicilliopsis zonata CBS 506.65]|uniref:Uncharacterized protein n=1 Tax=Penicilliopsis zonata CBS 506.65 TaxID=1073090 RepID=A0A1L9SLN9_9EURO|nr:hypothetical protein ASPZODRAFT_15462 [Penicilliopsis zonata CBS 506.65]OJJ48016.1 hypothetical protein ASPZODRAFT_15462 [Penicilliopsis zonata CBS 506.65]
MSALGDILAVAQTLLQLILVLPLFWAFYIHAKGYFHRFLRSVHRKIRVALRDRHHNALRDHRLILPLHRHEPNNPPIFITFVGWVQRIDGPVIY